MTDEKPPRLNEEAIYRRLDLKQYMSDLITKQSVVPCDMDGNPVKEVENA